MIRIWIDSTEKTFKQFTSEASKISSFPMSRINRFDKTIFEKEFCNSVCNIYIKLFDKLSSRREFLEFLLFEKNSRDIFESSNSKLWIILLSQENAVDLASELYEAKNNTLKNANNIFHIELLDSGNENQNLWSLVLELCNLSLQNDILVDTQLNRLFEIEMKQKSYEYYEKIFSLLPYPTLLLSNAGEIKFYNSHFLKLSISSQELTSILDRGQERIEHAGDVYKISRKAIGDDVLYVLTTILDPSLTQKNASFSIGEMGIVTSSIAHELNNPIGGILAAVSFLTHTQRLNEDEKQQLDEIRKSALRCKDLVELFLGFSRTNLGHFISISFSKLFYDALKLLRFRMIESNIKMNIINHTGEDLFKHQCSGPIGTMMFYLVVNELITSFYHNKLLSEDKLKSTINFSIEETEDSFKIIFDCLFDTNHQMKITSSKLIEHLLYTSDLSIDIQESFLIFHTS